MLTCITCSKQMEEGGGGGAGEEGARGTPSTKEAVKSLSTQVLFYSFNSAYCTHKLSSPFCASFLFFSFFIFRFCFFYFLLWSETVDGNKNHRCLHTQVWTTSRHPRFESHYCDFWAISMLKALSLCQLKALGKIWYHVLPQHQQN